MNLRYIAVLIALSPLTLLSGENKINKPPVYAVYDDDAGRWTLRGTDGNVDYSETLAKAAKIIEATPGDGALQTAKWVRVAAKFWAGVERDVREAQRVRK